MAIFQSSVLKKYLKQLDATEVAKAYKKYTKYFHNATIQQNIKDSNEEQYQATFLNELFVKILGFTLNPQPKYNLTTEFKNVKNARKADGAILLNDEALAVIELKGTNTKDLESIRQQAFDYKANQPGCVYVITSNFEKLRFYINNAVDFEEFDLFDLSYNRFEMLYLCLYKEHLLSNLPLKIKEASIHEEEAITKKFYSDYSLFKRELFRDIVKRNLRNPELKELGEVSSKKTLFKKTQKLLDRFLFIFFGEDRGLLPPNSIPKILEDWKRLKDLDAYAPLYSRYKKYFNYLNEGWKGKEHDIFAYNGGLFKPDTVLDTIEIDDELLYKHTAVLTKYDFESQVDVNILGHIFEHSLNEIESVNAEIEGVEFDKQKSKRKKDGVFYTPKYITKYIVDNTVGKLCEEKKTELEILEEEYLKGPKHRAKKTIKKLDEQLQAYRNWLLTLTICDPACGSGAFLNQALEFLIQEHRWIDEMTAKLFGGGLVFQDVENSILENNIYGVDLNDESVEIAKLSLWLRTAQKGRKLTSLNNNIKCGNSLIDSKAVAGDKAFKWEDEFPEVFAKGGFDVVIGNPPYGATMNKKDWLKERYTRTSFGNIDSYKYFVQLGTEIVKNNGVLSYIMPDSYLEKEYFKDLREFIVESYEEVANIKLGDDVFEEVNLPTAITLLKGKGKKGEKFKFKDISKMSEVKKSIVLDDEDNFITEIPEVSKSLIIIKSVIKDDLNTIPLIEVYDQVMGVKVYQRGKGKPKQTNEEKEKDLFVSKNHNEVFNYSYISQGIGRYEYESQGEFISYGEWLAEPRKPEYFDKPKVIIREIVNPRIYATFIDYPAVVKNIAAVIIEKSAEYPLLYLLALINSKLFTFYIDEQSAKSSNKSYPSFNSRLLKSLPIACCDQIEKEKLSELASQMLKLTSNYNEFDRRVSRFRFTKYEVSNFSGKLLKWNELEFADFIKELEKMRKKVAKEEESEYIKLSLAEEAEWMQYINQQKQKASELILEIDKVDKEIDGMVYELYGLSEEEVEIVENS